MGPALKTMAGGICLLTIAGEENFGQFVLGLKGYLKVQGGMSPRLGREAEMNREEPFFEARLSMLLEALGGRECESTATLTSSIFELCSQRRPCTSFSAA